MTLLYTNNKGTDQPAHLCSLISAFVIHFLESIMTPLDSPKISIFQLVSVAELAGLSLTWIPKSEDRVSYVEAHI